MSQGNLHPISEMAMHQQFLTQLNSSDASLFGIDPTLLPSHLAGYHGDGDDDGDNEEGEDGEGGEGDVEALERDAGDIPTPPFFSGELPPAAPHTDGRRGATKPKIPLGSLGTGPNAGATQNRITRLNDPRAQALMQLVPMPSQLPPGTSADANGNKFVAIGPNGLPTDFTPVDPRYAAPGTAGMIPHAMMLPLAAAGGMGGSVGLNNGNPNDQVGTWTESVNAYWQPMGLPAFQAPVLVSGGLAATIRDARLAWMVGESVCGHPSCLGRRFERKTNLLKHLLTHVEARPYVCQVAGCDQAFKQKWLLDRHGRVHAANKEVHRCPVPGCNTTCSSLYNLRNHELVHSETKKFLCDFENCGRTFATARNLRLHQRTHTGDKPFACDWPGCGMRYHRPAHLKRHQEVHSDNPNRAKPRKSRAAVNPDISNVPTGPGPIASAAAGGGGGGRKRKAPVSELDNEIDELAGDGDHFARGSNADGDDGSGSGGMRARPRRAAAVAAVAANRSKRWDEDIDLGDEEGEEEEDDEDEDEEEGVHMQGADDDDDEDDEEEEDGFASKKGQAARRRSGPGQSRLPIISSSGGPAYGSNGVAAPFSNARATYLQAMPGMMLVDGNGNAMMDPEMQRRHGLVGQVHPAMLVPMHARHGHGQGDEEMDDASPGVAPAAEGMEDNDEE